MTTDLLNVESLDDRRPRGNALMAWIVIAIVVAVELTLAAAATRAAKEVAQDDAVGALILRIQCRYAVAAAAMTGSAPLLYEQLGQFNVGPVGLRQRFIAVAADLAGPAEAERLVGELDGLIAEERVRTADDAKPFVPTERQLEVQEALRVLYRGPGGEPSEAETARVHLDALSDEQAAVLRAELGWFGGLALAPAGQVEPADRDAVLAPAWRTLVIVIGAVGAAGLAGVGGLVGLITILVLAFLGRLRGGARVAGSHHAVYVETFAVWLIIFLLLQVAVGLFPLAPPVQFTVLVVAFGVSLGALAWPGVRGVPWSQVREDIGWTTGRGVALETLAGLGGYAMALPIVAVGISISYVLIVLGTAGLASDAPPFEPAGGPAHPVVGVLDGSFLSLLPILLLGAVAAPIVEETMFRGVLYAHLRGATAAWSRPLSVLGSAAGTGFVFAIVHPQGWMAVPALMSLAIAFALAREWRSSLIAPMVMHGVSNALVLSLISTLAGA